MWILNKLNDKYGEENIVNVYDFGGNVYGVSNKFSDCDYIAVIDDSACQADEHQEFFHESGMKHDVNCYAEYYFKKLIEYHEISALECLFLNDEFIRKFSKKYDFVLSLPALRKSIAEKSSNSFVKARKKLRFGEAYIAKKSMWHSFRIIYFGIQIAKYGKIIDYAEANHLYNEIVLNESCDEAYYKEKYLPLHNKIMTNFRALAPKE